MQWALVYKSKANEYTFVMTKWNPIIVQMNNTSGPLTMMYSFVLILVLEWQA